MESKKRSGVVKVLFITFFGILLAGCAKYNSLPLVSLSSDVSTSGKGEFVLLDYKVFTWDDSKKYLGRNVLKKGYQPIQISIVNNTNNFLSFSKSSINLSIIPASVVAKKAHTSTLARAGGYGVAGLFIWPFLIPAVVDGVKSSEANSKLDGDFNRKELASQTIPPFGMINGIIFVSKGDFEGNLRLSLVNTKNSEKIEVSTKNPRVQIS